MKMFELNQLTIQTFDDNKERGRQDLAQIFPYDQDRIDRLNNEGAGIFFPINPQMDPHKRSIENTSHFKAVSLDLDVNKQGDGLAEEEINKKKQKLLETLKSLEIVPNYVIETKHGFQPIWEFEKPYYLDTPDKRNKANDFYRRLVTGVTAKTGLKSEGDNLCRVVRLPNSLHQKDQNNPFKITFSKLNEFKPTLKEFIEVYPPVSSEDFKKPLSEIVKGSEEGSRNIDATSLIGSLLAKYPPADWESICWPLLQAWNNDKNPSPLSDKELRSVFESITKSELQKRAQYAIPHSETLEITHAETNFVPQILSWKEFVDQEGEEQSWLIKDIFRPGWLGVLAGHGKIGKSTMAFHLLVALNKGLTFLSDCQRVPVTYINCEMGLSDLRDLIKAVTNNSPDSDTAQIITQVSIPLDFNWLESYLSIQPIPGVCVIDSFRGAFRLRDDKENQNGAVGNILRSLQTIARRTVWTIIVIHHLRKSGKGDMLDLAGGGEWNSAPDVILTWSCPNSKEPGTLNIIGRVPPHDPYAIKLSRESIEFLGTVSENLAGEERKIILDSLTGEESTSNELAKTTKIPEPTVRKRLTELLNHGSVKRSGEGKKGDPYLWLLNEGEE